MPRMRSPSRSATPITPLRAARSPRRSRRLRDDQPPMIAKLTGRLDSAGDSHAVIDVGGVGYLLRCSARTLAALPQPGGAVSVATEMIVREDAIELFGFAETAERDWFRLLTTVQGVGARIALALLSALPLDDLARAIAA